MTRFALNFLNWDIFGIVKEKEIEISIQTFCASIIFIEREFFFKIKAMKLKTWRHHVLIFIWWPCDSVRKTKALKLELTFNIAVRFPFAIRAS